MRCNHDHCAAMSDWWSHDLELLYTNEAPKMWEDRKRQEEGNVGTAFNIYCATFMFTLYTISLRHWSSRYLCSRTC